MAYTSKTALPAYGIEICEEQYAWAYGKSTRSRTDNIVLHHAAASTANAQQIHSWHLANGWRGIGYNFYVRKDGTICRGREIDAAGGHTTNYNSTTIGVCFEGNFETETMSAAQLKAGQGLVAYLCDYFNLSGDKVISHRGLNATACPGARFPMDEIKVFKEDDMTGEQIYKALNEYCAGQKLPSWAEEEFQAAIDAGITDGSNPMALIPRYQAAIMAFRAMKGKE